MNSGRITASFLFSLAAFSTRRLLLRNTAVSIGALRAPLQGLSQKTTTGGTCWSFTETLANSKSLICCPRGASAPPSAFCIQVSCGATVQDTRSDPRLYSAKCSTVSEVLDQLPPIGTATEAAAPIRQRSAILTVCISRYAAIVERLILTRV